MNNNQNFQQTTYLAIRVCFIGRWSGTLLIKGIHHLTKCILTVSILSNVSMNNNKEKIDQRMNLIQTSVNCNYC